MLRIIELGNVLQPQADDGRIPCPRRRRFARGVSLAAAYRAPKSGCWAPRRRGQGEDGIRQQLVVYHAYYNFCLPHASLRQPLLLPEPTNGSGSAKLWRPCTPAMAAGLSDPVWSLKEVLLYRVPPWPQPQTV
jgi:hypothetical protein